MRASYLTFALALLLVLTAGLADASQAEDTRLGSDGTVYHVRSTTLGEVMSDTSDAMAADPVLALEITRSDLSQDLILVPGTDGPEVEVSWFMAYESVSDTLFVVWQRRSNVHSQILLASYSAGAWTEVVPVSDQRFFLKSFPRLAITRDSFVLPGRSEEREGEQGSVRVQQATLHMVWLEEGGNGPAVIYAPILLVDGQYVGSHDRFTLSELFPEGSTQSSSSWGSNLQPAVRPTTDQTAALVGFVDPRNGQLTSIRISPLSGELGHLANEIRGHIIDIGARYDFNQPDEVGHFADDIRGHIIDLGVRMDERSVRVVGDVIRGHIIDLGARPDVEAPEDVRRLADEIRGHIIDLGYRLDERGLAPESGRMSITSELLTPDSELSANDVVAGIARFQHVGQWDLPELDSGNETLLVSGSGESALISWQDEGRLLYRETRDDGTWSEIHSLKLGAGLPAEQAHAVLKDHLDAR